MAKRITKKEKKEKEDVIYQFQIDRDAGISADKDNRELSIEEIRMAHQEDSQWESKSRENRKNRPKYEFNKLAAAVQQLQGDATQSQISSKVSPLGDGASKDMAEVFNRIIRGIENDSNAPFAYKTSDKDAFTGGIGGMFITTEEVDDSFDQVIRIKPIISAASSVWVDPGSTDECHRDARFFIVDQLMTDEAFKVEYGEEAQGSTTTSSIWTDSNVHQERNQVTVSDYWVKKPKTKTIYQMNDGSIISPDNFEDIREDCEAKGLYVVKERTAKSHEVLHYKISGDRILSGPNKWAGKHIPVILQYGFRVWIEGEHHYRGIVRFAKDAQRFYNYARSTLAEQTAVNLANDRLIMSQRQVTGNEKSIEDNNPRAPMIINPDPSFGPPQRIGSPGVNNALIEQSQVAGSDILETLATNPQAQGRNPEGRSGVAMSQMQSRTDLATAELFENRATAQLYITEQLVDLIPKIYDTEQTLRIFGEDGKEDFIEINKTVYNDQTGQEEIVNDLSVGRYSVVKSVGPSYQTRRDEALDTLWKLMQTNGEQMAALFPEYVKLMNAPFSEQAYKDLRKPLLAQGIVEPNEEELQEMQEESSTPEAQQQAQVQQLIQESQIKAITAESELKTIEVQMKQLETQKVALEIQLQQETFDSNIDQAETDVEKTESEIMKNAATADKAIADAKAAGKQSQGSTPSK